MSRTSFVGRQDATRHLLAALRGEESAPGKLSVLSVEGPGGIGKTFLFDHVLATNDLSEGKYLTLRVDGGAGGDSVHLFPGVDRMVNAASAPAIRGRPAGYYFAQTKQVLDKAESIELAALREMQRDFPADPEVAAIFRRLLDVALALGKGLNELAPLTRQYLDARQLEKWTRAGLEDRAQRLRAVHTRSRWLGGILPDWLGVARDNAIKENAPAVLANALLTNLSAILSGYRNCDKWRPLHAKLPGVNRVLLVIDDYEALHEQWGDFLVARLLPGLREAEFQSVVVILGRDHLANTHTDWDQHLRGSLLDRIALAPFSQEEVESLVNGRGVADRREAERAWRDTLGHPFYLQLWLEEMKSGGRTFTMLKRFYDRTTKWMTDRQKGWLEFVVFLDRVDRSTLRRMLEDEREVVEVSDWFENEGSVREVAANGPRMREYIRSRLSDYLYQRDPDRCRELAAKASRNSGAS
jgi:hypothetical protein